jgi:hypothetical protein
MGRFINSDVLATTGQNLLGNNMFAYCGNNPVDRSDFSGTFWDTVLDVVSLIASVAEVVNNPDDVGAWIGLACDVIDVAVPFVGGLGETARAVDAVLDAADAVDDVYDAGKAADNLADMTKSCDGLCFVAGTQVHTANGLKNIEDITADDYVWAWNETTGETALKKVVETYVNETKELVHVFINGEEIIATPSHPFYSPVKGWTDAVNLRAGDILVLVNGEYVVVEKVQHEILEAPLTVYNFQVEDDHTYFVGEAGTLVHNQCRLDDILEDAVETTSNKGITSNYEKLGGYDQAYSDFMYLEPTDINSINTQYGAGLRGTLSNGSTLVLRPGSKTGGITLEVQISSRRKVKIRY